ncbi:LAGLIDADG family homing endonuclease [Kitasatospora sp. NBC_01246]|uniref:LAGLIDADG family homing endonuclease n=1 Tax=Kitasatospora sp. NBC_01246 TaxID=2903570 RepID=UPI002E316476|nr:LAGLIDADG family homing endonuclease [Kitasatospora sp. NBC_01246]
MTFLDLERPDHAYMFAFLQADGHLSRQSRNRGRLSVELSACDAPVLEEFQRLCPYNSSIRHRTRSTNFKADHTSVTWTVCAREFREELQVLGLPVGRKADIVAPPGAPFSERDYLRGLIDADGSVGITAKGFPFISFATRSDDLAAFCSGYVERLCGARRTLNRNKRDAVYNILYTKENALAVSADLYYSGCLAIPRKLASAERAAAWIRPADMAVAPPRRRWTPQEDDVLLRAPSLDAVAVQLGRTRTSCSLRKWRLVGPERARARIR